jgi:hypothetical protein
MFGRKKDFMKGMGEELVAAYSAATNHEARDAVVEKYARMSGHSTNGVRGYLVSRNVYIRRHLNHVESFRSRDIAKKTQYDHKITNHDSVSVSGKTHTMRDNLATPLADITDYTVVTGKTSIELVQNVKEKMLDEWQPFGAVAVVDYGLSQVDGSQYIQAMVKYRKPS